MTPTWSPGLPNVDYLVLSVWRGKFGMLAEGRFQGLIQEKVSKLSLNSRVSGSCHLPGRGRPGDPVGSPTLLPEHTVPEFHSELAPV